jgi:hypothetical protein
MVEKPKANTRKEEKKVELRDWCAGKNAGK